MNRLGLNYSTQFGYCCSNFRMFILLFELCKMYVALTVDLIINLTFCRSMRYLIVKNV